MDTFTAIDFETSTGYRNSICQVGLVRVENGTITKEINLLVQPPDNYYWNRFTGIHGISFIDTLHMPSFEMIWSEILPYIAEQNVVAHNGFGFDFPVLDTTLNYYTIPIPAYNKFCTYKIYKTNLANLCKQHRIPLNHHDALSDARACAELFLRSHN